MLSQQELELTASGVAHSIQRDQIPEATSIIEIQFSPAMDSEGLAVVAAIIRKKLGPNWGVSRDPHSRPMRLLHYYMHDDSNLP